MDRLLDIYQRGADLWDGLHLFTMELSNTLGDFYANLYLPEMEHFHVASLLGVIVLFWPVFVTLAVSLVSVSAWFFWLVTSAIFGIIQLGYVMYHFSMISLDIVALCILKTYAILRSRIGSYTIKSGFVTKISRRREWRRQLDAAKCYKDFLRIEIQEPKIATTKAGGNDDSDDNDNDDNENNSSRGTKVKTIAAASKRKNAKRRAKQKQQQQQRPSFFGRIISSKSDGAATKTPKNEEMEVSVPVVRTTSFQLSKKKYSPDHPSQEGDNVTGQISGSSSSGKKKNKMQRSHSFASNDKHHHRQQQEQQQQQQQSSSLSDHDEILHLPKRQRSFDHLDESSTAQLQKQYDTNMDEVERELGMRGGKLLTTMNRLQEARIHATRACNNIDNSTGAFDNNNNNNNNNSKKVGGASPTVKGGVGLSSPSPGDDDAASSLKFLLTGVVKRNHLQVDDLLIEDARSLTDTGRCGLSKPARDLIRGYNEEVERCLDWIAESPLVGNASSHGTNTANGGSSSSNAGLSSSLLNSETVVEKQARELTDRMTLVRKMKQNMGRTALMLSGGGAQAMYHLGTIRALVESKIYKDITVISGTSGGSISAAMCATKTPEELYRDVCVPTVSTDYMLTGEMKKNVIRWFPPIMEMGAYWLKHSLLVDSADFKKCCDFYYGDITFEEAFERTGKHVCITVTASRTSSAASAQRLLLNHISTPHVTISSAVACSCALPGVMKPAKLVTKDSTGKQEPFEVDGTEWIDGSVQADLPFKRISTLFNVSNYIVCQTNFHVVPFLNKAHHPSRRSLYWQLFQTCEWDIRNRALKLSRLGLFPKIFGQDMAKIFQQKYHKKLTLVPRFTTMQTFGLKALSNPSVEDMEQYLQNGQSAAWPYISAMHEMIRLERALDLTLTRLDERLRSLNPEYLHQYSDELESLSSFNASHHAASTKVRFLPSKSRETEKLKNKVLSLESENEQLRRQLEQLMKQQQGSSNSSNHNNSKNTETSPIKLNQENDSEKNNGTATSTMGSAVHSSIGEKVLWTEVRRRRKSFEQGKE